MSNPETREHRHPASCDVFVSCLAAVILVSVSYSLRGTLNGKPFWLIFLIGFCLCLACILLTKTQWLRKLQLLTAALFVSFFLLESAFIVSGWFAVGPSACRKESNRPLIEYYIGDTDLGYRPLPGMSARFWLRCGDTVSYDVVYNIDEHGQRVTKGNPGGDTLIFFGGSFTFGEGVEDHQSLPAVMSRLTDHQFNVVNYGFHGWGPHQMLRILETRREKPRVGGDLRYVVYTALDGHVRRCVGATEWDTAGPMYRFATDGKLEYQGPFRSGASALLPLILNQSWGGAHFMRRLHTGERSYEDYELFAEIVAESARIVRDRYDAPFSVLVWPKGNQRKRELMLEVLRNKEVNVIDAATYDVARQIEAEKLQHDPHPNARAYELLAPWLVSRLNLPSRTAGSSAESDPTTSVVTVESID